MRGWSSSAATNFSTSASVPPTLKLTSIDSGPGPVDCAGGVTTWSEAHPWGVGVVIVPITTPDFVAAAFKRVHQLVQARPVGYGFDELL